MQYPPSWTLIFAKILLRNFLKVEFCVRRKNLFRQQKIGNETSRKKICQKVETKRPPCAYCIRNIHLQLQKLRDDY